MLPGLSYSLKCINPYSDSGVNWIQLVSALPATGEMKCRGSILERNTVAAKLN